MMHLAPIVAYITHEVCTINWEDADFSFDKVTTLRFSITVIYDLWIIVMFLGMLLSYNFHLNRVSEMIKNVIRRDFYRRLCNVVLIPLYILFLNENLLMMAYLWGAPSTQYAIG